MFVRMFYTSEGFLILTMGKCVFCGNLSNNEKGATLHKFPRDEALCKQWVKLIGLEGWKPKDSSLLCSDHFPEDSFVVHYNNRKRLKPGIVPTILMKNFDDKV